MSEIRLTEAIPTEAIGKGDLCWLYERGDKQYAMKQDERHRPAGEHRPARATRKCRMGESALFQLVGENE